MTLLPESLVWFLEIRSRSQVSIAAIPAQTGIQDPPLNLPLTKGETKNGVLDSGTDSMVIHFISFCGVACRRAAGLLETCYAALLSFLTRHGWDRWGGAPLMGSMISLAMSRLTFAPFGPKAS